MAPSPELIRQPNPGLFDSDERGERAVADYWLINVSPFLSAPQALNTAISLGMPSRTGLDLDGLPVRRISTPERFQMQVSEPDSGGTVSAGAFRIRVTAYTGFRGGPISTRSYGDQITRDNFISLPIWVADQSAFVRESVRFNRRLTSYVVEGNLELVLPVQAQRDINTWTGSWFVIDEGPNEKYFVLDSGSFVVQRSGSLPRFRLRFTSPMPMREIASGVYNNSIPLPSLREYEVYGDFVSDTSNQPVVEAIDLREVSGVAPPGTLSWAGTL